MKNLVWRIKTEGQKLTTVLVHLDRKKWLRAWDVARKIDVSEAIARKYLRLAVQQNLAEAEPPLHFKSIGALERTFRLASSEDK